VSDVEFLRKVNGPKSKYHRSDWYKGSRFTPNEDTLISMTDEAEHKSLRSRMTAGVRHTLSPLTSAKPDTLAPTIG